jgi:hypothetical protein
MGSGVVEVKFVGNLFNFLLHVPFARVMNIGLAGCQPVAGRRAEPTAQCVRGMTREMAAIVKWSIKVTKSTQFL